MAADAAVLMFSRTNANVRSSDNFLQTEAQIVEGYTVITAPEDDVIVALSAADLPVRGTPYPGTVLLCTERRPRRVSPTFWVIDVTYEGQLGPGGENDTPINQPPVIQWDNVTSTEAIDEDATGSPIVTATGETIEGVTKPVSDFRLVVERNYLAINMPATAQYLDSVNSDTFEGFAPGTAHLETFSAQEMIDEDLSQGYWRVRAEILFRTPYQTTAAEAWYARTRHEGYMFYAPDGRKINAIDDNQFTTTRPVLLTPTGGLETNPANANWLTWKRFSYELSYNALGLV